MKKLFFMVATGCFLMACGNDKSTPSTTESGPATTNVQNVNGNQPDSSNGITLSTRESADTLHKDSLHH